MTGNLGRGSSSAALVQRSLSAMVSSHTFNSRTAATVAIFEKRYWFKQNMLLGHNCDHDGSTISPAQDFHELAL